MSKSKNQRTIQVRELMMAGYTQDKIAEKLNISKRTIARDMQKIKIGAEQWLENLANYDFVDKYRQTLEGFDYDRTRLEELYTSTDDVALKHKIIESIHHNRELSLGLLVKAPITWGIDRLLKMHNPISFKRPKTMLDRLGSIDSDEIKPYNNL